MRVAIVCDWLTVYGGAEHAVREWTALWPEAPLFTTVARPRALGPLADRDIRVTPLQRLYRLTGNHQVLLPLMPRAVEGIDLRGFDVILSSSHAVAKGIVPPPNALHVCYCHTPMRYAWEMEEQYLRDFRVPRLLRGTVRRQLKRLRRWDLTTAARVDHFLANSTESADRVRRTYARDAQVILPPAGDAFYRVPLLSMEQRSAYLAIGRLVPYKRFDLLIRAANTLRFPLVIAGTGQDERRLRAMAGPTVQFLGYVPEVELPSLYGRAKALLTPQLEDAGIIPMEAQACGTPVIAYGRGGVVDTVQDGITGVFFPEQTVDAVTDAIGRFEERVFDPERIRHHARPFHADQFRGRMREAVERAYRELGCAA